MPGPISHSLLVATCESFPLASAAAHACAILALGRTKSDLLDKPTQRLADELAQWLRPRVRGLSLEAIRQTCERAWFEGALTSTPLSEYVVLVARRHLQLRGSSVALRTEPRPGDPLQHFRWLSLLVPPDLLVAAIAADAGTDSVSDTIDICPPQLSRILQDHHPVAETHVHVGAAVSFDLLWIGLISALAQHPPDAKKLERGGKPPFGSGRSFLSMLQVAAITRLLLASFLWNREYRGTTFAFSSFIDDAPSGLSAIADRTSWPWGIPDFLRTCRRALHTVITAKNAFSIARLNSLYRHLLGNRRRESAPSITHLLLNDPLSDWLPIAGGVASPENRFTARSIRYLRGAGRDDHAFALAFWQYQRIRNLTFRHLVVEPGTAGLDWFRQYYDRISPLRGAVDGARFEAAIRLTANGTNLRAFEARTAPEPAWQKIRDLTRDAAAGAFVGQSAALDTPEVGLILHFLKLREAKLPGGRVRLHADPRQIAHGCRFGAYAYERQKEAVAIETALAHMPEVLLVLRGIDIASSELAVPIWALAPFLLRVRRASDNAATALHRYRPNWRLKRFGMTLHAGEEFRRLSEGMRHVHELLEFHVLCAGDRIGHGLAVGTDAGRWARDHSVTTQPAEERLDDLLWEIDRYENGDFPLDAARVEYVRGQARDLANQLYARAVDISMLGRARILRHNPLVLDRIGYPFTSGIVPDEPIEKLVHEHLTHSGLFLRGQRPLDIATNETEIRMLTHAGKWIRQEIATREITIEANPSSNMLIADMQTVEEHPAFRFQPLPRRPDDGEPPVHLSVNTDDPISFATSLAHEFAYLYGALLRDAVASHEALTWLARRRVDGWRSRFTLAASAERQAVAELFPPELRLRRGLG